MVITKMIKTFFMQIIAIITTVLSVLTFVYVKGRKSIESDINNKALKTIKKSKNDYEKDKSNGAAAARMWLREKHTK